MLIVPSPLRIHVGNGGELVFYNGGLVVNLQQIEFTAKAEESFVVTSYTVQGCYPALASNRAPEDALSNESYPLRIYVDHKFDTLLVWLHGKPVSHVKELYINLHATKKRLIRMVFDDKITKLLADLLVSLGVEVDTPEIIS